MNDLIITKKAPQGETTMSSIDLLSLVNNARIESGESQVRHADFAARCRDELDGEYYETFVVRNQRGPATEALMMSADQCKLVAMRESKAVRRNVLARLKELESREHVTIPQTLPGALRLAADLADQNTSLRLVVEQQAPQVEALARIAGTRGTLCLTDAAKHLGVQRKVLLAWMRENRWIYRRQGAAHWLGYQPRLQAGLLDHKVTVLGTEEDGQQRLASQVRVTPKGLSVLAQRVAL